MCFILDSLICISRLPRLANLWPRSLISPKYWDNDEIIYLWKNPLDTVSANVMISVRKWDESQSGQMVLEKSEMNIFWCITNNVKTCKKVNEKTQTLILQGDVLKTLLNNKNGCFPIVRMACPGWYHVEGYLFQRQPICSNSSQSVLTLANLFHVPTLANLRPICFNDRKSVPTLDNLF